MWVRLLITIVVAYFLGNLNGAILTSKLLMHDDVRNHGSGNAGLTNFIRNYGASRSIMVILVDTGKAVLACMLAGLVFEPYGYQLEGATLGGICVMLGHDFPALQGFRGGKGILSGWFIAWSIDWRIGLAIAIVFFVTYFLTKYVSLGSVLSSGSFGFFYAWAHPGHLFPIIVGFSLSVLLVWMHRGNIKRLVTGTESKFSLHRKKS